MDSERFWEWANSLLDQRRDPLEDERLREHLAEHPADLDALLSLRTDLARIEPRREPVRRRRAAAIAALTCVMLASIGAVWFLRPTSNSSPLLSSSRVIDFTLTVVRETPLERTTTVSDGVDWVQTRERLAYPSFDQPEAPLLANARIVTRTSKRIEP
jgi:hypothetical protein